MSRKPLTNESGEVRELTRRDMRQMKPAADVLPAELVDMLPKKRRGERGPQKRSTKQQVTLRLDRDVVDYFRATGDGWQSRINEALRKTLD
ncbi:BrnA antitoxin family protein [Bosea sp. 117]|uniref:BrnA antitoxin family protein n=1 Tax=Bosea sp. 117 TaxID=1125973 RepID=UPI00068DA34E|nr:BrnA antitoxin family protein [Bosea sp. 117]